MLIFCKKDANISKIKVKKGIFSETKYVCELTYEMLTF